MLKHIDLDLLVFEPRKRNKRPNENLKTKKARPSLNDVSNSKPSETKSKRKKATKLVGKREDKSKKNKAHTVSAHKKKQNNRRAVKKKSAHLKKIMENTVLNFVTKEDNASYDQISGKMNENQKYKIQLKQNRPIAESMDHFHHVLDYTKQNNAINKTTSLLKQMEIFLKFQPIVLVKRYNCELKGEEEEAAHSTNDCEIKVEENIHSTLPFNFSPKNTNEIKDNICSGQSYKMSIQDDNAKANEIKDHISSGCSYKMSTQDVNSKMNDNKENIFNGCSSKVSMQRDNAIANENKENIYNEWLSASCKLSAQDEFGCTPLPTASSDDDAIERSTETAEADGGGRRNGIEARTIHSEAFTAAEILMSFRHGVREQ